MNLKKQVKEKQHKTEEITNTTNDQNKMIIELKEDNSKSKTVSNVKDVFFKDVENNLI